MANRTTQFGKVEIGKFFTIHHLPGITFLKIAKADNWPKKVSKFSWSGPYNALSHYGSPWMFEDERVVEIPDNLNQILEFHDPVVSEVVSEWADDYWPGISKSFVEIG